MRVRRSLVKELERLPQVVFLPSPGTAAMSEYQGIYHKHAARDRVSEGLCSRGYGYGIMGSTTNMQQGPLGSCKATHEVGHAEGAWKGSSAICITLT